MVRRLTICAGIATQLWRSPSAVASPSDDQLGLQAFSGTATSSPVSTETNPSALATGTALQLWMQSDARLERRTIQGVAQQTSSLGGALHLRFHVSDDFALGAALSMPPRAEVDPSSPATGAIYERDRAYRGTFAGAYRLAGTFYLGLGVAMTYRRQRLGFALDAPSPATYALDVKTASLIETTQFHLGILWRIAGNTWLGVTYHSPPAATLRSRLAGTATMQPLDAASISDGAELTTLEAAQVDAEVVIPWTDRWEWHIAGRWRDDSRATSRDIWLYGDSLRTAAAPAWIRQGRGLRDVWLAQVGLEGADRGQPVRLGVRLTGGTGNVNREHLSPRDGEGLLVGANVGAQVRLGPGWAVVLTSGLSHNVSQAAGGSAHQREFRVTCEKSQYDYSTAACAATREGFADFDGLGAYTRWRLDARLGLLLEY